jgi:hypothetical protein
MSPTRTLLTAIALLEGAVGGPSVIFRIYTRGFSGHFRRTRPPPETFLKPLVSGRH